MKARSACLYSSIRSAALPSTEEVLFQVHAEESLLRLNADPYGHKSSDETLKDRNVVRIANNA